MPQQAWEHEGKGRILIQMRSRLVSDTAEDVLDI